MKTIRHFEISTLPLPQALLEYAHQAGVGFVLPVKPIEQLASSPISGEYTQEDALNGLLECTPLRGEIEAGAVRLVLKSTGQVPDWDEVIRPEDRCVMA